MAKTETELKQMEKDLKQRERGVAKLEGVYEKKEKDIEKRNDELDDLKAKIIDQKQDEIVKLTKKCQEKENDIANLQLQINELNLKKKDVEQNAELYIEKAKIDKIAKEQEKILKKYEKEKAALEKELSRKVEELSGLVEWSSKELNTIFDSVIEEFKKSLSTQNELADQRLKSIEESAKLYEEELLKNSDVFKRETELKIQERKTKKIQEQIDQIIDKKVKEEYQTLWNEKENLQILLNKQIEANKEIDLKLKELQNSIFTPEYEETASLKSENESLRTKVEELTKIFSEYDKEGYEELKDKSKKYDELLKEHKYLLNEKVELENKAEQLSTENSNVEALQIRNRTLEAQFHTESLMLQALEQQINDLSSRLDNKKLNYETTRSIESHYAEFENLTQDKRTNINEVEWLENIIKKCAESGYKFSNRLFYSFHTSIKTSDMSPLTVLAGVSGTGKSKLPQLYSRFGGLYFISLPVKPDWDSPQSLFGYYNSIDKKFYATNLLKVLVSFQQNKSNSETKDSILDLSDNVCIVLLDEMNLAHIELYFSDLLSKLEERRDGNKNIGFEVEMGESQYKVVLTDNVKWVGTMNEDETTKSLSDKVIDRGNIISFPRPDHFERYTDRRKNKPLEDASKIKKSVWDSWLDNKVKIPDDYIDSYMKIVLEINDCLRKVNRALGHRVWQSIEDYMSSHPIVKKYEIIDFEEAEDKDKINFGKALDYAFEEALVQKVMPKLRGIETEGEQYDDCLEKILKILDDKHFSIVEDFKNAIASVTGTFVWDSAFYLNKEYEFEE